MSLTRSCDEIVKYYANNQYKIGINQYLLVIISSIHQTNTNHDKKTFSGPVIYKPAQVTSDSLKTIFTIYYTNYFIQLVQALPSGTLTKGKNQNMVRTSLARNFVKTTGKEIGLNICQQIVQTTDLHNQYTTWSSRSSTFVCVLVDL